MSEHRPPSKLRARLQTALGIVVSLALILWLFKGVDWAALIGHIRGISLGLLLATIGINYLSIPVRVRQWQWLLGNPPSMSFMTGLKAICLGYLGNCVFPMRGGELVRTYVLARHTAIPFSRVLTSVVLSRIQDFLPILTIAFLMFLAMPLDDGIRIEDIGGQPFELSGGQLRAALHLFALGVLGIAAGLAAFYVARDALQRLAVRIAGLLSSRLATWTDALLGHVSEAMQIVGTPRYFWGAQGLAFVCWLLFTLAPVPLLVAFGLTLGQACLATITITGLTTFAQLLPAAPGAIGTFHAMGMVALYITHPEMDRNAALAYVVVSHAIGAYSTGLVGLPFLPVAWKDLRDAQPPSDNDA